MLPSAAQIAKSTERLFVIEDWHNFGQDYDPTFMAYFKNFDKNWDKIKHKYGEEFYRMWKYFLLSYAGSFRARYLQVWQIVFSKDGIVNGYESVR
jgi:cyclopropane-fatty-acyl-phospholipid synthase